MSKVMLITGTSKGIGKYLSEYYLKKGFIVAGCSRGSSGIEDKNYVHYSLDASDENKVVFMVRDVEKKFGGIDVLINNAGIASMNHILLTPVSTLKKIFETNFTGTFLFTREAAKIMLKKKSGKIINFTSVAAPLKLEGEAIYAASKSAIENFTKISAKELSEFGITVNAVGPTPISTDLIKGVPDEKMKALVNTQLIKRYGEFDDVTNVIDFFIDGRSGFITGQVIYLGGINN